MKPVTILSGPIGAGKTTVAKELVKMSPGPTAYIEGDTFWTFIAKAGEGVASQGNFKTIMRAMTSSAMVYALGGYDVILDFSVPPWFLGTARKIAQFRAVPLDYIVLRPSQTVCAQRAAARSEGTIPDYTPYVDLYSSFNEAQAHIIQDDEGDATTVAERVREAIDSGKFRIA